MCCLGVLTGDPESSLQLSKSCMKRTLVPRIVKMKSLARSYIWCMNLCTDIEVKVKDCAECQASWQWPLSILDYVGVPPKISTLKMSTPRMSTPECQLPKCQLLNMSTPKMSTPKTIYVATGNYQSGPHTGHLINIKEVL